ncbi:F-box/kelch-repeat protein At1g22040 [Silene latifolia]|uniref:F-box/kelch-repeat protein At1g22040 n=1 Tax=Silene latifolia TaxID=37657 RepID=UPI003D77AF03
MGGVFSLNNNSSCTSNHNEGFSGDPCKRQRVTSYFDSTTRLIPYLPDEISLQILARVPRIHYLRLKQVSRCWKEAVTNPEIYNLRREFNLTEEWLFMLSRCEGVLLWHALDPVSQIWLKLPPMPYRLQDESRKPVALHKIWDSWGSMMKIPDAIKFWLGGSDPRWKNEFCGCSMAVMNGYLYVIGGLSRFSTLRCVWCYDPILNIWTEGTPMLTGRAYSKTGVINNKLYAVGGVSKFRNGIAPLQSAEVFDPETGQWSEIPNMPFSKAQVMPTAFLADFLKPMATGLTTYKGKLYVPQSLYCWPFFVDAGGEIYDPETNSWTEMPVGMGEGWPAKQAGTKLSAVVDDELYAIELSGSWESAKIKVYDHRVDSWKLVHGEVPVNYDQTNGESPYLLTGLSGKLHVIIKDANCNFVVLQGTANSDGNPVESSQSGLFWKVITHRQADSAELISCQVLGI